MCMTHDTIISMTHVHNTISACFSMIEDATCGKISDLFYFLGIYIYLCKLFEYSIIIWTILEELYAFSDANNA